MRAVEPPTHPLLVLVVESLWSRRGLAIAAVGATAAGSTRLLNRRLGTSGTVTVTILFSVIAARIGLP
jgi:hypothetical protein